MALLKAILDTLEGVEEHFHGLYTNKNGKFEFTGVEGMKTSADTDRLQTALNAERNLKKEAEAKLAAWGDLKPDETLPLLQTIPELKILAEKGSLKKDEKEIEAIVNGRLAPLTQTLAKLEKDKKDLADKVVEYQNKDTKRTIFDAVRKYATETKANPDAYGSDMGGLMLLAKEVFTVDSAGQVVVKEGAEGLVHGTHIKDAIPEIQKTYHYLWPSSQGGNAPGSSGGPGASSNPFKTNDMTARSEFAGKFPDKVDAMVKQAGLSHAGETYKAK